VLAALAGVRTGDTVAVVGDHPGLLQVLRAASGADVDALPETDRVRVAVATAAYDVPLAVARLAPGGRLVAVAADAAAAGRTAERHDLVLRYVVPVARGVAWSAASRGDD
jgi:hypothetical protein